MIILSIAENFCNSCKFVLVIRCLFIIFLFKVSKVQHLGTLVDTSVIHVRLENGCFVGESGTKYLFVNSKYVLCGIRHKATYRNLYFSESHTT